MADSGGKGGEQKPAPERAGLWTTIPTILDGSWEEKADGGTQP